MAMTTLKNNGRIFIHHYLEFENPQLANGGQSHGNDNFKKQRTNFYSSLRGFEKTEVIHKKKFYYVWIASAINSLAMTNLKNIGRGEFPARLNV